MIREYATDIASQMGIQLSDVSIVEGRRVGCSDVHLVHMTADSHTVSVLVYSTELDNLKSGCVCERLEMKIKSALNRLQLLLEP